MRYTASAIYNKQDSAVQCYLGIVRKHIHFTFPYNTGGALHRAPLRLCQWLSIHGLRGSLGWRYYAHPRYQCWITKSVMDMAMLVSAVLMVAIFSVV